MISEKETAIRWLKYSVFECTCAQIRPTKYVEQERIMGGNIDMIWYYIIVLI